MRYLVCKHNTCNKYYVSSCSRLPIRANGRLKTGKEAFGNDEFYNGDYCLPYLHLLISRSLWKGNETNLIPCSPLSSWQMIIVTLASVSKA